MVHGTVVTFMRCIEITEEIYLRLRLEFLSKKEIIKGLVHDIKGRYFIGLKYDNYGPNQIKYKYYLDMSLIPKNNLVRYSGDYAIDTLIKDMKNYIDSNDDKIDIEHFMTFVTGKKDLFEKKNGYTDYKLHYAIDYSLMPFLQRIKDSDNKVDSRDLNKFILRKNLEDNKVFDEWYYSEEYQRIYRKSNILRLTDPSQYWDIEPFALTNEEIDSVILNKEALSTIDTDSGPIVELIENIKRIDANIDTDFKLYGFVTSY